jgi:ABC-type transport system involved in multi-copper enzyme maturation permease subunit
MFGTLVRKEIVETILDLRFVIVTVLFIVLIPLGMYVGRKDYERRLANYRREHQMYRQHYGNHVYANVEAQGFRPPPILSMFAMGIDSFIPEKAITSRRGLVRPVKQPGIDNPQALLFGKADFLFNVSFIVSLAALIFAFNRVSGEKEKGTLKIMISQPVRRAEILVAKIVGNYIVLLIPFIVALLAALVILSASSEISIWSLQLWPAMLVMVLITFLFILAMVGLGVCISTLTRSSVASIMVIFLIWVVAVLGIPKISPMIAEAVYPIESRSVAMLTESIARKDIEEEFERKKGQLYEQCRLEFGLEPSTVESNPRSEAGKQAHAKYDREALALDREREKRIAETIRGLKQNYRNKQRVQTSIAVNLSRLSPISCYTYLIAGLSGTGPAEPDRFAENAERYQELVTETIYRNFIVRRYGNTRGSSASSTGTVDGFDESKAVVPDMEYRYTTITQALQASWPDLILLFVFNLVFFALAFVRFNKYDVR